MSGKARYGGIDRKALQSLLRDAGFYSTEGRLHLLGLLKRSGKPVSVPAIAERLGARLDEVNVYRALESLATVGILSRSDLRRGGAHYEFAHGHHHHVVCRSCGKTEDVEGCKAAPLESRVLGSTKLFARVDSHSLEFFGTCVSCAA